VYKKTNVFFSEISFEIIKKINHILKYKHVTFVY